MNRSVIIISLLSTLVSFHVYAEQCTEGVHAILPWTGVIRGNAEEWVDKAGSLGFKVNNSPGDNTVLVFPRNYGHGINSNYGHVAVLLRVQKDGFLIQDSNGIAGGDRGTKLIKSIDFGKVHVIHEEKENDNNNKHHKHHKK